MEEGALASGVTILSSAKHHFEPEGMRHILLLAESHVSIHTYPDLEACFVDFFTCGTQFKLDKFDQILSAFLEPKKKPNKLLHHQESCYEIPFTCLPQLSSDR